MFNDFVPEAKSFGCKILIFFFFDVLKCTLIDLELFFCQFFNNLFQFFVKEVINIVNNLIRGLNLTLHNNSKPTNPSMVLSHTKDDIA